MLKLGVNTKILLIREERGERHSRFSTLDKLVDVLTYRFGEDNSLHPVRTLDIVRTLETRGWVSPQDTMGSTYCIVYKALPMKLKVPVIKDEISIEKILLQLKV